MDNLVSILKTPSLNRDVKNKILRCIQTWAISFKGKFNLGYVEQVYKTLKAEGKPCRVVVVQLLSRLF
jgi:growth factor-regulated tyrosine kinase substrate